MRNVFRLADRAAPIEDVPDPLRVRLPLGGARLLVRVGDAVAAGQRVAESPGLRGDVHASIGGVAAAVDGDFLTISRDPDAAPAPERLGEVAGADADALRRGLAAMGVPCADLTDADLLVVNALEPEPGVTALGALCRFESPAMLAGARLAQRIAEPSRIVLAAPRGAGLSLGPNPVHELEPRYPDGLDALTVRAVTGRERPGNAVVVGADRLWLMGRAALEGRAATRAVLTVRGRNLRVAVGASVRHVLDFAGLAAHEGDRVLLGGALRGEAVWDLDAPVPRGAYALTVLPRAAGAVYTDAACMNCGECHLICPARILVGIMARFAEFGRFEGAQRYGLDSCLECGLCAWVCPARRPLLQFIRLARRELARAAEAQPPAASMETPGDAPVEAPGAAPEARREVPA